MRRLVLLLALAGCGTPDVIWDCACEATCEDGSIGSQHVGSICAPSDEPDVSFQFALKRCGAMPPPCTGDRMLMSSRRIGCTASRDKECVR